VTNFNEVERQRWGGPSPWAGKDPRTEAQHRRRRQAMHAKPGPGEARDAGACIRVGVPEPGYLAPLIPRCCNSPRPMTGGLIEFIGVAGRTQTLYCLTCKATIAELTWNVEEA
jgi:hypothetical protein